MSEFEFKTKIFACEEAVASLVDGDLQLFTFDDGPVVVARSMAEACAMACDEDTIDRLPACTRMHESEKVYLWKSVDGELELIKKAAGEWCDEAGEPKVLASND